MLGNIPCNKFAYVGIFPFLFFPPIDPFNPQLYKV